MQTWRRSSAASFRYSRNTSRRVGDLDKLRDELDELRKAALRFRGSFSRALAYQRNDLVQHGGSAWLSLPRRRGNSRRGGKRPTFAGCC